MFRCESLSKKNGKQCGQSGKDGKIANHLMCEANPDEFTLSRCYPQFNYTCNNSPYYMPCTPTYLLSASHSARTSVLNKEDCPKGFK